jgi:hypothetical protein
MEGDKNIHHHHHHHHHPTSSFPFLSKYGHNLDITYNMCVCMLLNFGLYIVILHKAKVEKTGISMSGEIKVLILAVRPHI